MRRLARLVTVCILGRSARIGACRAQRQGIAAVGRSNSGALRPLKVHDLTPAIAPGRPLGLGCVDSFVGSTTKAGASIPGLIGRGSTSSYEKHRRGITAL